MQVDSTNEERFKANYPAANNVQYKNTQNDAEVEEVPLMDDGGESARRKKDAYQPPAYYQPPVRPGGAPVVAPPGTGAGTSNAGSNRPAVVTATTPQKRITVPKRLTILNRQPVFRSYFKEEVDEL